MKWLRRVRDWYLTKRTHAAIADRECRHDGSEPMCWACHRDWAGW